MAEEFSSTPVKFNMGLAYMERLHNLLKDANNASRLGVFGGWHLVLCALHRELSPKMNDTELKESSAYRETCTVQYNKYSSKLNLHRSGLMTVSIGTPTKFLENLNKWDEFLRKVMNRKGFMPEKDSPYEAWGG